jgi:GT2 family glycosyltransferase
MNKSYPVSIIIVNYNTSGLIENLLISLENCGILNYLEIIIVNNSKNDIYLENIKIKFPGVILVHSDFNVGFGAACNLGLKHSNRNYIAFVNPDILFTSDIFEKLIGFANSTSDVGFIGGILHNKNSQPCYSFNSFPGYYWETLQAFGIGSNREIQKLMSSNKVTKNTKPFEVDWLIGAFLFVSKKLLDELKGFDERFFLYYEDVDIQHRAKLLGYKNYCLPYLYLEHFERGSVKSDKGDDIYHFYMNKSKMMYYYLYFPFFKRNILRILLLIGLFLRIIALLPRTSFPNKRKKFKQYYFMLYYFIGSRKRAFENRRIYQ